MSITGNGIIHAAIQIPFSGRKVLGAMKAPKIQVSISAVAFLRGIVVGDAVPVNGTEICQRNGRRNVGRGRKGRENIEHARWSRRLSTVHHRAFVLALDCTE